MPDSEENKSKKDCFRHSVSYEGKRVMMERYQVIFMREFNGI